MRPIKFRAWDGREMFYDILAGAGLQNVCDFKDDNVWWWHEPPQAIMQFTGLLDKNGKEIWEGDILFLSNHKEVKMQVVWDDRKARFELLPEYGAIFAGLFTETFYEVIGNIYENPELLK